MLQLRLLRKVASDPAALTDICWSPDGASISYVRSFEKICLTAISAGEERELTSGETPTFTPDGSSIVFARDTALFRHEIESGREQPIAIRDRLCASLPKHSPVVSPDGRKLLFQCRELEDRELKRKRACFCIYHFAQASVDRLSVEASASTAAWSPDSQRIACANYESGARIFIVGPNAEVEARFSGMSPAFSHDSSRIAYTNIGAVCLRVREEGDWKPVGEPVIAGLEATAGLSYSPILWLDDRSLLSEEQGQVRLIDLERANAVPIGAIDGLIGRGAPTLAWAPDRSLLAAEVEERSGSAIALFQMQPTDS